MTCSATLPSFGTCVRLRWCSLAIAIGSTKEGIGRWGEIISSAYVLASWMGAAVAEPCVSLRGRNDLGPIGCEAGEGYTKFLRYPSVCKTSYAALERSQKLSIRHVVFLKPVLPSLSWDGALTQIGSTAWSASLPRNQREAVWLKGELAARKVSLALIADSPRDSSLLKKAIVRPVIHSTRFTGWLPEEAVPIRRASHPIHAAAENFTARLGKRPYLLAHWRVEKLQPSDAAMCAHSLDQNAQKALRRSSLPVDTPLILMSDAPAESTCTYKKGSADCVLNRTMRATQIWHSDGPYGDRKVRKALAWLHGHGWHTADEQVAMGGEPLTLLQSGNFVRYLAEYEMALDAAVFVSCSESSGCYKCSEGRRSAAYIVKARGRMGRQNYMWAMPGEFCEAAILQRQKSSLPSIVGKCTLWPPAELRWENSTYERLRRRAGQGPVYAQQAGPPAPGHEYLFVVALPCTGSTAILSLLSTSPYASNLCADGHVSCDCEYELDEAGLLPLAFSVVGSTHRRWSSPCRINPKIPKDWKNAIGIFSRYWNRSASVVLEKSLSNVWKVGQITENLARARRRASFLFVTRSTCASCGGRQCELAHSKSRAFQKIENISASCKAMVDAWQQAPRRSSLHVRYEDMISDPYGTAQRIVDFVPQLRSLDPSKPGLATTETNGRVKVMGGRRRTEPLAHFVLRKMAKARNHPEARDSWQRITSTYADFMRFFGYWPRVRTQRAMTPMSFQQLSPRVGHGGNQSIGKAGGLASPYPATNDGIPQFSSNAEGRRLSGELLRERFEAETSRSCALCVVGQLSRLELFSKLRQVVWPNIRAGNAMAMLLVLSRGTGRYVNANNSTVSRRAHDQLSMTDGPYARYDEARLRWRIMNQLNVFAGSGSLNDIAFELSPKQKLSISRFGLRISLVADPQSRSYMGDKLWADSLNKRERGREANLKRQQLHMEQWSHLRRCMFLLDAEEQDAGGATAGARFGVVLKLRDDSMALTPWLIPNGWSELGLTAMKCLAYRGIADTTYAVGRRWAWAIMEGLSADWYLSHHDFTPRKYHLPLENSTSGELKYEASAAQKKPVPDNPEGWLAAVAELNRVPVSTVGFCSLPFVSIRFVSGGRKADVQLVVKPLHLSSLLRGECFMHPNSKSENGHNCKHSALDKLKKIKAQACPKSLCSTR
eukprot:CAMPEP_0119301006 /NCGR_PEP_ID=MMETSP1333-20130426/2876_1 /TAXON_ID=418940 /ORGANISM="Scyphosphaera apsteinii, Strain RCC1455" /LENGTH=1171 /DNA_ID=CAMNT_0007302971 /DNA_START=295 /DNA_END=3810 /DNA_ORIENTATION=-